MKSIPSHHMRVFMLLLLLVCMSNCIGCDGRVVLHGWVNTHAAARPSFSRMQTLPPRPANPTEDVTVELWQVGRKAKLDLRHSPTGRFSVSWIGLYERNMNYLVIVKGHGRILFEDTIKLNKVNPTFGIINVAVPAAPEKDRVHAARKGSHQNSKSE